MFARETATAISLLRSFSTQKGRWEMSDMSIRSASTSMSRGMGRSSPCTPLSMVSSFSSASYVQPSASNAAHSERNTSFACLYCLSSDIISPYPAGARPAV